MGIEKQGGAGHAGGERGGGTARRWLTRAGLLAFGCLLSVVIIELGLQVASWVVRTTSERPIQASLGADRVRVLCLGDSNTYGLYLEREDSYPSQLEVLWNQTIETPKIEVVNLGFPGSNSTRLLRDLKTTLDEVIPDVVILMVGVNDFWTERIPEADETTRSFWRRHSRLYRVFLLLSRGRDIERLAVSEGIPKEAGPSRIRVGDEEIDVGFRVGRRTSRSTVERDLIRLIDQIREWNVELRVMTYPARFGQYQVANTVVRGAAREAGASLVDLETGFRSACPELPCPDLLFEDGHPTRAGYAIVARTLVDRLSTRQMAPTGP